MEQSDGRVPVEAVEEGREGVEEEDLRASCPPGGGDGSHLRTPDCESSGSDGVEVNN